MQEPNDTISKRVNSPFHIADGKDYIHMPPAIINAYIKDMITPSLDIATEFVPTMPTDIDAFTEQFPGGPLGALGVYDRMFRMRRLPFPHIKCEQLLYYFYAREITDLYAIQESFLEHFDEGVDSAEDINRWYAANASKVPAKYRTSLTFHSFKIYQLNESRDIIDFGTARTWSGNKIIIEYDYHHKKSDDPTYDPTRPDYLANRLN